MRRYLLETMRFVADMVFPQPHKTTWLERCTPAELRFRVSAAPPTPVGADVQSLFSYRDPWVRHMVWEIKYRGSPFIRGTVAVILAETLLHDLEDRVMFDALSRPVIITDIPMPRERKLERGWNQSELLAKETARQLDPAWAVYRPTLSRTRKTKQQTTLRKKARKENMKGAFKILRNNSVAGKTVVIIDDVTTTGTTLEEAIKTLKKAGARQVFGYTVAH